MLHRLKSTLDEARQAVGAAVGVDTASSSDSLGAAAVGQVVSIGGSTYRLIKLLAEGTIS